MKQLLFLLLFPCLALAQYTGNAGQKITLGEQTSADGLVYRGIRADTASKIVPFSDTSAYIILDTVEKTLWLYKAGQVPKWQQVGGSSGGGGVSDGDKGDIDVSNSGATWTIDTSAINLSGNKVTGTLPVANGGTGSATQNFVDLTTTQSSIAGAKTFTTAPTFSTALLGGSGGTGITTFGAATRIPYAASTTALTTSANITFVGDSSLVLTKDASIGGQKVGRGKNNTITTNMAFGSRALNSVTTGNYLTAIGSDALRLVTTGVRNTAVGYGALENLTTGDYNGAFGFYAGQAITTGPNNIAFGTEALYFNRINSSNVAVGYRSLYFTGYTGNDNADYNTGVGGYTGSAVTNGANNTFIGFNAGYADNAGAATTTGNNNILIGYRTLASTATVSNEVTIGNSSSTSYRIYGTWSNISDIRDKSDIINLDYGMNFIEKLKPVKFVWDMRDGGKIGIPEIGFIAQDLQQAQIDTNLNIPNLVNSENENQLGISSTVLIPIIVKALQEANDKIKSLELRIFNLENK